MPFQKKLALAIVALFLAAGLAPRATEFDALLQGLKPSDYVTDLAHVLSPNQKAGLERYLRELEQKTGAEMAVVTLKSLQGGEINDFANRLFERWGIGKKGKNNGILFLLAVDDHKVRIEVGYGLEALIPDARAGRILDQNVMPLFREGRVGDGVTRGTVALAQIVANDRGVPLTGQPPTARAPRTTGPDPLGTLLLVIFTIFFLFIVSRHPFLLLMLGRRTGGWRGGGFGGGFGGGGGSGGFGGFGGGSSGGGGASRSW